MAHTSGTNLLQKMSPKVCPHMRPPKCGAKLAQKCGTKLRILFSLQDSPMQLEEEGLPIGNVKKMGRIYRQAGVKPPKMEMLIPKLHQILCSFSFTFNLIAYFRFLCLLYTFLCLMHRCWYFPICWSVKFANDKKWLKFGRRKKSGSKYGFFFGWKPSSSWIQKKCLEKLQRNFFFMKSVPFEIFQCRAHAIHSEVYSEQCCIESVQSCTFLKF